MIDLNTPDAGQAWSPERAAADNERFFSLSLDMLCIAGTDGFFRRLNPAFEKTLGYTEQEMLARPFVDFIHPDDIEATLNEVRRLAEGERTIDFENRYRCKNGQWKWLSWRAAAHEDGSIFAVARDETERHQVEQMKREFISTVSHELRTPLTSVSGALGLIDSGALGELPERVKELVTIASKNSKRLLHLINDLLDIERIGAGKMHFEMRTQPLLPLLELALESNRSFAEQFGVRLLMTLSEHRPWVQVDADRLLQVLTNLLSNAIKFSFPGGSVKLLVKSDQQRVRIEVSDHGCGIPDEFRPRVFEKFTQAPDSHARGRGGSGLGLAIAKQLVECMHGSIDFSSMEGLGTTFHVELPAMQPAPEAVVDHAGASSAQRSRILVVEDDPDVARLIELLLREGGYFSETALSGGEGLRRLRSEPFDAVTLDLLLPDMTGADFLRLLRSWPETADLPVVVVSGIVQQGQLSLSGEFAALDWLPKPIDQGRLLGALQRVLAGTAARSRALHGSGSQLPRVLHVDDDDDLRALLAAQASQLAHIDGAASLQAARSKLAQHPYAAVVLDLTLPDGTGWELLPKLRELQPPPAVLILSAAEVAVDEVEGVAAALVKARCDEERLLSTLNQVLNRNLSSDE